MAREEGEWCGWQGLDGGGIGVVDGRTLMGGGGGGGVVGMLACGWQGWTVHARHAVSPPVLGSTTVQ